MDFLKNRHGRRRSMGALNILSGAGGMSPDSESSTEAARSDFGGEKEQAKKTKKETKESKKKRKEHRDERPPPAALVFPPHRAFSPMTHVQEDGSEPTTLEIPSSTMIPTLMPIPPTPTSPATPTQASTLPKSKPLGRSTSASARMTLGNLAFGRSTDSIPLANGNSLATSYSRDFSSSNPHLLSSSSVNGHDDMRSPNSKSKGKPGMSIRSLFSASSSSTTAHSGGSTLTVSPPQQPGVALSSPPADPKSAPSVSVAPSRPSVSAFSPFSKSKSKRAHSTHGHGGGSENHGTSPSAGSNHGHSSYAHGAGIGYTPTNTRQGTLFSSLGLSLSRSSTRTRTLSTNTSNTKYTSGSEEDGVMYARSREDGWMGGYDEDQENEEDDIRRPSGLGRSASFSSQRSMPSTIEEDFLKPVPIGEDEGPKKPAAKAAMLKETLMRVFGSEMYGGSHEQATPELAPEPVSNGSPIQPHESYSQSQTSLLARTEESHPSEYERTRAISTPNLLRSFSHRMRSKASNSALKSKMWKDKLAAEALQITEDVEFSRPPTPPAKFIWPTEVPSEVLENILIFLPRWKCAQFARISKSFASAARGTLYTKLVICRLGHHTTPTSDQEDCSGPIKMKPEVFEKLARLLAARPDLTDLVRVFICEEWPIGGSGRRHRRGKTMISHFIEDDSVDSDKEEDHPPPHQDPNWDWEWNEDRLAALAATFIRAFQRMHRLTELVLPSFELRLLRHHSAFGLVGLTFLDERFGSRKAIKGEPDEKEERKLQELLAWLDGQVNIKSLRFPLLADPASAGLTIKKDERSRLTSMPTSPSINVPFLAPSPGVTPRVAKFSMSSTTPADPGESPVYSFFPPASATVTIQSHSSDTTSPNPDASSAPHDNTPTSSSIAPELNIEIPTFSAPRSPSHSSQFPTTPISSPTLLPDLEILQGPPSLITLFSTPIQSSSSPIVFSGPLKPKRPLQSVTINIDSTLYTGLRPAALLSALHPSNGSSAQSSLSNSPHSSGDSSPKVTSCLSDEDVKLVKELGFKFGMVVDRRTVEKVLSAAGGALGGYTGAGDGDGRGRLDGDVYKPHTGPGVEVLNIELTAPSESGRDVKFEEALYRIIHNVLPHPKPPTHSPLQQQHQQQLDHPQPHPRPAVSYLLHIHSHSFKPHLKHYPKSPVFTQ
ncbi:hypothetical protein BDN72DRAFT_456785 [Pluteus cervinus]|uniref:Uncharacterized protein n=1 Tax=Pluteus cervinus TaxID=181527 RepID=A0ACD3B0N5_9AGAR|nr:hypothetical protein BDN72DRAFT_456785 [Pluteus cervinus]